MPFIPHTQQDIESMLKKIGVAEIEQLFDEIPNELRCKPLTEIPEGSSEMALSRELKQRAALDAGRLNFMGAGAYEHHIPSAVWDITTRGEYMTAYTPYQAEASQATLQLIYEYQTMMARLTRMDVSNASLYDGASALAEAVLMAVRAHRKSKSKHILVAGSVHPYYLETVNSIVKNQNIRLTQLAIDWQTGSVDRAALQEYEGTDITAVIVAQPNFLGALEEVDTLIDWTHAQNALVIAVVNPLSLAILKAPGEWGEKGADIVCGEGQCLGVPLASGGPYFGFMTCKQALVRQMPGRIVGRTIDQDGQTGFTLTLQAREQHIRRAKATSNICTNQGLAVTAATIYMALMGNTGLRRVAHCCYVRTQQFCEAVKRIEDVTVLFSAERGEHFHEVVLALPVSAASIVATLQTHNILAGVALSEFYPKAENLLMVCLTETKTEQDIMQYVDALQSALAKHKSTQ